MTHLYSLEWAPIDAVTPVWVDSIRQTCELSNHIYWQKIATIGLLALTQSQEVESGSRKTQVKLSAYLQDCHHIDMMVRGAYRLTDTTGQSWLLGYAGAVIPLSVISDIYPDSPTERTSKTLVVTADIPLLKII